jgi:hypothetical protein
MRRVAIGLGVVLVLLPVANAKPDREKEKPLKELHISVLGEFLVRFPDKPREESRDMATSAGVIQLHTTRCDAGRDLILSVVWCDYPEEFEGVEMRTIMDGVADGLRGRDGKIVRESDFAEGLLKGRVWRIEAERNIIRVRAALAGRRLYQIVAVGPRDRIDLPMVDEFFQSFTIRK